MDVWVGQHYRPYGIPVPTFSTRFTLFATYSCLCAAFELCWYNCLRCWAVTCNEDLLCLKHHPAKSSFSPSPRLDPMSSPLYEDSMHSYVTHKNGWDTVLLKYRKPVSAQTVVQADSWRVKKESTTTIPQSKQENLLTGNSKLRLHKTYWNSCPVTWAESIASIHGIGKWQV